MNYWLDHDITGTKQTDETIQQMINVQDQWKMEYRKSGNQHNMFEK